MEALVEEASNGPALGEVAQLTDRAEVAEEGGGLLPVVEGEERIEERVGFGRAPVVGAGGHEGASRAWWRVSVVARYHVRMLTRNPEDSAFEILPAVDLRGGRVVRLVRGDFARETVYGADPVAVALRFVEAGARWLHVVDLDGARDPARRQDAAVAAIVAAVGERARVEVAGGLRDRGAVAATLAAGAARAVVGTAAISDPAFARQLIEDNGPDRIAVALDVRDGMAVGHGWRDGAPGRPVEDVLQDLAAAGVTTFEATAIERDGTLAGPDLDLLGHLVALGRGQVIASAGVASIADLDAARAVGCRGAIVGRALYDGRLALADAIAATRG